MPRETAAGERRVALIPEDVRRLVADADVLVEHDAGRLIGRTDADFRAAGATVVDRATVFARSDVVAWVKPPVYELDSLIRPGMTLLGFQDPIVRREVIAGFRTCDVESVGFETVPHEYPDIDALSAMSRIAGAVAYVQGRQLLPAEARERPVRSLILGCGQAGRAAITAAVEARDEPPTALGNHREQEAIAIRHGARRFLLSPAGAEFLDHLAAEPPDLIIGAAVHRGSRGPVLIDEEVLNALRPGTVIIDLVGKSGGNCVAMVPNRTVTLPNGVIVTHCSNYPAMRPVEASRAYSAAVAAMIKTRILAA
ncbi:hypothetical protein [Nocardia sp. NPDC052566]|uniref:hypothetical protein n=1 Tax=Nocardia sp. NPDC052566 TaxID=3364330 RepID=UPI0037C97AF9